MLRSRREGALWAVVLTVLVAILAASVVAGTLTEAWGAGAILVGAFAAGLGFAAASVVGVALSGDHGQSDPARGFSSGPGLMYLRLIGQVHY